MTDVANEVISAEDFREQHTAETGHIDAESVVAVDPGQDTGVAVRFADGELKTYTRDFWGLMDTVGQSTDFQIAQMQNPTYIVEAPYLTKFGKGAKGAIAYNSGGVAREAELLVEGLRRNDYHVIEHDPRDQGQKYDSDTLRSIIGDWNGPNNSHTRDAIRLLLWYGVIP